MDNATADGDVLQNPSLVPDTTRSNVLGKRKRDSSAGGPEASSTPQGADTHDKSFSFEGGLNPIQLPTPQASNPSDGHSQVASTSSNASPEYETENTSRCFSDEQRDTSGVMETLPNDSDEGAGGGRHRPRDSPPVAPESNLRKSTRLRSKPTPDDSTSTRRAHLESQAITGIERDQSPSEDNSNLEMEDDAPGVELSDPSLQTSGGEVAAGDEEPSMDVDAASTSALPTPMADNVEFSDEDGDNAAGPAPPVASDKPSANEFINYGLSGDHAFGRVTDREVDARSMAPERRAVPRVLRRRWTKDTFEITTPESLEEDMERKQLGQKKPRVQSGTKILHKELRELGLEEWIDTKDKKNNPEYRKAVTEARKRHREKVKLETLARLGVAGGEAPDVPNPPAANPSMDPLDQSFEAATRAFLGSDNGQPGASDRVEPPHEAPTDAGNAQPALPTITNEPSQQRAGRVTRRKQKLDDIQRRDQLAKEAMEMMD